MSVTLRDTGRHNPSCHVNGWELTCCSVVGSPMNRLSDAMPIARRSSLSTCLQTGSTWSLAGPRALSTSTTLTFTLNCKIGTSLEVFQISQICVQATDNKALCQFFQESSRCSSRSLLEVLQSPGSFGSDESGSAHPSLCMVHLSVDLLLDLYVCDIIVCSNLLIVFYFISGVS